jgi:hypothetical protein
MMVLRAWQEVHRYGIVILAVGKVGLVGTRASELCIYSRHSAMGAYSTMSARDDAVTKLAAALQLAIGYASGEALVPNEAHAKMIAEPVVDAILAAAREEANHESRSSIN